MIPTTLFLFISSVLILRQVQAQRQCDGTPITQAADMPSRYPMSGQVAQIVDGDHEAQALFDAIMDEGAPPLEFAPHTMDNGAFNVSYDYGSDPECWWSASTCHTPKYEELPTDYYFCPSPETWGLSIDDGPTCAHTPLYDMLQQNNQLASLYYIGVNILSHPAEAQRGYTDGHEICVHTWTHPYMTTLTNEEVFAELYYTKKAIKEVVGYSPRCWRPPYGDVDDRVRTFAAALDLRTHIWNHDTDDWQVLAQGEEQIAENYEKIFEGDYSTAGIVVLTHELNDKTVEMLVDEYANITRLFKHITPVSTCMNDTTVFAEADAPQFPDFHGYVQGYRGENRTDYLFFSSANLTYIGDGLAASYESSLQPSSMPSSASSSASASMSASASSSADPFSATYQNTKSEITVSVEPTEFITDGNDSSAAFLSASLPILLSALCTLSVVLMTNQ